jgi:hypothetical protein
MTSITSAISNATGAVAGEVGKMASDGTVAWMHHYGIKSTSEHCTFAHQELSAASDLAVESEFLSSLSSTEVLSASLQAVVLHGSELLLKADEAFASTDTALSQDMLAAL